jgi:hypothetical protein
VAVKAAHKIVADYKTHSFRIGDNAHCLVIKGYSVAKIQHMGRQKYSVFQRYLDFFLLSNTIKMYAIMYNSYSLIFNIW